MVKVLCPTVGGQNKCKYNKNGECQAKEIEMGWEIVTGYVLYYCATEENR